MNGRGPLDISYRVAFGASASMPSDLVGGALRAATLSAYLAQTHMVAVRSTPPTERNRSRRSEKEMSKGPNHVRGEK